MSWTRIEVAVPLPVFETYSYVLPKGERVAVGGRVLVPYGRRQLSGVVLAIGGEARAGAREVVAVVDREAVLSPSLLQTVLRTARDALCPPGLALAAALPPGTAPRPGRRIVLREGGRRALERGEARGELSKLLWSLGRAGVSEETLRQRFPQAFGGLARLERIGWIRQEASIEPPRVRIRTERIYRLAPALEAPQKFEACLAEQSRAPRRKALLETLAKGPCPLASSSALRVLLESGQVLVEEREIRRGTKLPPLQKSTPPPVLTSWQRESLARITDAVKRRRDTGFLLYGITGSGKTEVYLRATREALKLDRSAIVLVPEISLTHQVVDRFRARFGDAVAVLHSGLSQGERFDQWRAIRAGHYPIVIGARSAIFAPVERLGLVVIDEEHDPAYKSDEGFRYHAREVAEQRAHDERCPWVLGSATPDLESAYRAQCGELERLVLPERIAHRPLPEVELVDMNGLHRQRGRRALLSRMMRTALAETLAAGQQAILFLNRRGFATLAYCFHCGHALRCKHCDISLVYHAAEGKPRRDAVEQGELRCHYCGYNERPSLICPNCRSPEGALLGFGTERVEEEVAAMFPHARVGRLDRDTSARKGEQHRLLRAFHRHEIDVMVGTQMLAKGHDIPGVTLVGVIAADLGLHFPDFRAGERTFQLLAQVAGRAGRGDDPGRVIIQTFLPDHYAIAHARTHDYPNFFREEIRRRRTHGYPPLRDLVQVVLSGASASAVEAAAYKVAHLCQSVPMENASSTHLEVLGPAPAPVTRVRDRFRWHLLILGTREDVRHVARVVLRSCRRTLPGVQIRVDASPLQML